MQTSFIARALFKRSHQVPISDKLIKIKSTFTYLTENIFVFDIQLFCLPYVSDKYSFH